MGLLHRGRPYNEIGGTFKKFFPMLNSKNKETGSGDCGGSTMDRKVLDYLIFFTSALHVFFT